MTIKEPRQMSDSELMDAYGVFIGFGPVLSGEFPEQRAIAIAHELHLRGAGLGDRIYVKMSAAWGSALRKT